MATITLLVVSQATIAQTVRAVVAISGAAPGATLTVSLKQTLNRGDTIRTEQTARANEEGKVNCVFDLSFAESGMASLVVIATDTQFTFFEPATELLRITE